MNKHELWASIELDLTRALQTLPESATNHETIGQCREFLAHNELELACDALECYADEHAVSDDFWIALRVAAKKMDLPNKAARCDRQLSKDTANNSRS